MRYMAWLTLAACLVAGQARAAAPTSPAVGNGGLTDWGQTPYYAQTAWAGAHRDGRNSDFVPYVAPAASHVAWTALDGVAVLPAPVIGPEGHRYAVSAGGPGTSHLHAFDAAGNLLWESAPQLGPGDLDSLAAFSSPTLDRAGNIYLGDGDQFWSFAPDGAVRWVADLPEPGAPMASSIITPDGAVGGATINGKIVLFNRADGSLAAPVLDLPGGSGPPAPAPPPGLWAGGLMDPASIGLVYRVLFGYAYEVINTPAVHPETGRLFVVAAGASPEEGVLYGIDRVGGALQIVFATPIGPGSGTSPTLSGDGARVYVADNAGAMRAIATDSGAVLWVTAGAGLATSPAVGPDETIFTGAEILQALAPADGSIVWSRGFDELAAAYLPPLPPGTPYVVSGEPAGKTDGVVTVAADRLVVGVVLGYQLALPGGGVMMWPGVAGLATLTAADGALLAFTPLRDTHEGVVSVAANGATMLGHAAVLSSIVYYGLNPLLPPELQLPAAPAGGFSVLAPVSARDQAAEGVTWVTGLVADARAELPAGDLAIAFTAVRRGRVQLEASLRTVLRAEAVGELDEVTAAAVRSRVRAGYIGLIQARAVLAQPAPGPGALLWADGRLAAAGAALAAALALLHP